jgi:protein required for attachment to host cells
MDIPRNTHVLVMDGGKLLLFKNDGDEAQPVLSIVEHRLQESAATRDQGSDGPGTSFESVGPGRSSYEQTDFHQLDEDQFAIDAADMLEREVLASRIGALIIMAPPRTLGELRKHLHGEVKNRVIGEIAKDLAGHPTAEIMAAIAKN